jgi:hypothetical protein
MSERNRPPPAYVSIDIARIGENPAIRSGPYCSSVNTCATALTRSNRDVVCGCARLRDRRTVRGLRARAVVCREVLDLQRCAQPLSEQRDRRVVDRGGDPGVLGLAPADEPGDVGWPVLDEGVGGKCTER